MQAWLVALPALITLSTATAEVPAWQEPGFVMEEIVVTATRPAWQTADFVLEEVVVTATAADVAAARAARAQRHELARLTHLTNGNAHYHVRPIAARI